MSALAGRMILVKFTMSTTSDVHDSEAVHHITDRIRAHGEKILMGRISSRQEGAPTNTLNSRDRGYAFTSNERVNALADPLNRRFITGKNIGYDYYYLTDSASSDRMTFAVESSSYSNVGKKDPSGFYHTSQTFNREEHVIESSSDRRNCKLLGFQIKSTNHSRNLHRGLPELYDVKQTSVSRLVSGQCVNRLASLTPIWSAPTRWTDRH